MPMTATNPHPLANPLNQSRFKNYAYGQSQASSSVMFTKVSCAKELTVPEAKTYDSTAAEQQRQLTVPNQDIPYYNGPIPASGFLGQTTLFKLADGSILDMKKYKIVFDPSKKWRAQGYWNDPNSEVSKPHCNMEWGKTESIESMLANVGKPSVVDDPNLSPESIAYWKKADEESKKLEQNLTDEQKQLLDALHAGKLFKLSKLVEEDDVPMNV